MRFISTGLHQTGFLTIFQIMLFILYENSSSLGKKNPCNRLRSLKALTDRTCTFPLRPTLDI